MKFYPCKEIQNIYGKTIMTGDQSGEAATLGWVAIEGLLAPEQQGEKVDASKKLHRWNTARRIKKALDEKATEIDLPSEDISMIKDLIGKMFHTALAGPALSAIESNS